MKDKVNILKEKDIFFSLQYCNVSCNESAKQMKRTTTYFWHRYSAVRGTIHTLTQAGILAPFGCFCSCIETQTVSQKGQLYPLDLQRSAVVVCSQVD